MPATAASEAIGREQLAELQLRRLRETVARLGGRPDDVASLDDLPKLPFTVKADLREHYPFGMLAVPRAKLVRVHASSGTGGKPTVVGYTAGDLEVWTEVMARCLAMGGVGPGTVVHNAYGYGLFTRRARLPHGRRAPRGDGDPRLRRADGAPGDAPARPRRPGALLHPVLRAAHRRGAAGGRHRGRRAGAGGRLLRRRAVDRVDARRARVRARPDRAERLRALRGRRPGRRRRVPRGPGGPARAGGPLP